jgi:hypothetical protein
MPATRASRSRDAVDSPSKRRALYERRAASVSSRTAKALRERPSEAATSSSRAATSSGTFRR